MRTVICGFSTAIICSKFSRYLSHSRILAIMNPNSDVPLATVLNELRTVADQTFEQARPIPAATNHSRAFHEHERKTVFMQERVCLGREDEISAHGNYLTDEIAGVPVFVVRQKDGAIAAFVNACAHRFACLLPSAQGSAKRFTCRYHAWTYNCEGDLVAAPHMEMKPGFSRSEHKLRPLQVALWQGFIYVTLTEKPRTILRQVLKPLADNVVGRYHMAGYKTVLRETMTWNANWKNLIENFTESYHVPVAHRKTFAKHEKPLDQYICGEDSDYYSYHRAPQKAETGLGAAHANNTRLQGEWRRMMVDFCIFPCHLVTLMPDYLWWIAVQPHGVDQFNATWGVAFPPEILEDVADNDFDQWLKEFKNYMDVANDEDKELVEALHKGSRSPVLPQGAYHPIERNLWQFNRYLARLCGA